MGDQKPSRSENELTVRDIGQRKVPRVALLIETSREYGRSFLYGIARYARLHGPWRVFRSHGDLGISRPNWTDWKVDGAIMRDVARIENRLLPDTPIIFAQHNREDYAPYPSVITNSRIIGRMGAEHFLDRGFEHFAYCGFDEYAWSRGRSRHFTDRIKEAGFRTHVFTQSKQKSLRMWKNEQHALSRWLMSLPKPLALMCCNDDRALQAVEACKAADLVVPDEVAVLGVDNDVLVCELSDPPISSVALNTEEMGYEAAKLLDSLMHGNAMSGQIIDVIGTHIVTRQSTDILAVRDQDVRAAVHFMRENANQPLQVGDVVKETCVSRRVLEKKFRSTLRRSIFDEIRRIRIENIVHLLEETDMPISAIARSAGFDGIEHVARYCRKVLGMSLRDYRRQYVHRK